MFSDLTNPWQIPRKLPRKQPATKPYPLLPGCVLAFIPERDTKWYDFSQNENHGTITGAIWTSKGRNGPGVYFDASGDYVSVADSSSLDISNEISVEAWYYCTATGFWSTIVAKDYVNGSAGWILTVVDSDGNVRYHCPDNTYIVTTSDPGINTWHHVIATNDGTTARIYIDGEEEVSGTVSISTTNTPLYIGCRNGNDGTGQTDMYKGYIDLVRVYNRKLDEEEVKQLYGLGKQTG